jgi:hypothetical protein
MRVGQPRKTSKGKNLEGEQKEYIYKQNILQRICSKMNKNYFQVD